MPYFPRGYFPVGAASSTPSAADIAIVTVLERSGLEITLEEKVLLRLFAWGEDLADISACTATVQILNGAGSTVLSETAMDASGTTERLFSYLLETGTGELITAAGYYKAVYRITYEGSVARLEQDVIVLPVTNDALPTLTRSAG